MNIIKVTNHMLMLLFLLLSLNVHAETEPFKIVELFKLNIKLSKDGTGIVKGIHCNGCDFNYVKITQNSRASENGAAVDIQQAKKRAGNRAVVSFDPNTQEVQFIRWFDADKLKK